MRVPSLLGGLILFLLPALLLTVSASNTRAQFEQHCDACTKAGLRLIDWQVISYDLSIPRTADDPVSADIRRGFVGRIYFYFQNSGQLNWKIETVRCAFTYQDNSPLYDRPFDLAHFEVSRDTFSLRSDPFGLTNIIPRMKSRCWIEDAVRD